MDLHANVTVDSDKDNDSTDGKITFHSTVNGARTLTLDADRGAVELKGAVGGTTKLTGLTVDGGQVDLGTVATTGAIDIGGTNIDLNGATYESDDGDITLSGPVDLHTRRDGGQRQGRRQHGRGHHLHIDGECGERGDAVADTGCGTAAMWTCRVRSATRGSWTT